MMAENERLRIVEFKNWKESARAPSDILRGAAAVLGSSVYCSTTTSKKVLKYDSTTCKWSTLPDCPQQFFALAIVNETLTAIGGFRGLSPTGALQSLTVDADANTRRWTDILPPMPTKRGRVTAICVGKHLIVAAGQLAVVGGRLGPGVSIRTSSPDVEESGYVRTVEMLDTESEQWYALASLPKATTDLSLSLCGGNLYLLGGWSSKDRDKSVITCHLKTLLRTASNSTRSSSDVWQSVADVPVYASTSAVLFDTVLLAIGGFDDSETSTDKVYSYDPSDNSWSVVGRLLKARYQTVAATLPGNRVIVVGGYDAEYKSTTLTEIGNV